jgi:hypothetical protein
MITDADTKKLETAFRKVFATKEEFTDLRLEFGELNGKFDVIATKIVDMDVKFDRVIDGLALAQTENAAEAAILNRHDRQIQALAAGTGVQIPQD